MPWKCEVCTLLNADDNVDKCNLCNKPKGTPDPDKGNEKLKHLSLRAILKLGPGAFDAEIQEVKRLAALKEIKGVFGVVLNTETPVVVCDCIAYLRGKGLYTEGLFRVPGQQDTVDALKLRYCKEEDEDVLNEIKCEVNDVGTLLKSYFRWLPEPIVPRDSYDLLLDVCRCQYSSKLDLEDAVFDALSEVISPNRECLSLLIQFLREVTRLEKYNKMSPANLATCFAPTLMRAPEDVSPEQALMDMGPAIGVLVVLIRSDRELYLPPKNQIKKSTRHKPKGVVGPPPGEDKVSKRSSVRSFSLRKAFSLTRGSGTGKGKKVERPPGLSVTDENPLQSAQPPPMPERKSPPAEGVAVPPPASSKEHSKALRKPSAAARKGSKAAAARKASAARKLHKNPHGFNIDESI
mmetsp:Transcript_25474/g.41091  ORF Transcript_25474/g.41091 Transcript_25474/m.41091 type:complete len:407 (-) Transcript_25474:12-1232(-)